MAGVKNPKAEIILNDDEYKFDTTRGHAEWKKMSANEYSHFSTVAKKKKGEFIALHDVVK